GGAGRAGGEGSAIADAAEVVGCLLETIVARRNTFRKPGAVPRDIIDGPMVPRASRRIGIVAEHDETVSAIGYIGPSQGRRQILAVASEAARDHRAIGECRGPEAHPLLHRFSGLIFHPLTPDDKWQ